MVAKKKPQAKRSKKSATKSAAVNKPSVKTPKITFSSLNKWNLGFGVLLFAQAVAILFFSNSSSLPVTTTYLTKDSLASAAAGQTVLAPAVRHLFDIHVAALIAAFLLVSAVIHTLIATMRRKNYEEALKRKVNGWRWTEYSFTAGLMLVTIAMLNGMYDAASLVMVFVLVALLQLLGFFGESNSVTSRAKWQSFVALCATGATVWLAVDIYLKSAIVYGSGLPKYIYWVNGTIFVLTLGLALNTFLAFKAKGKWADYLYGERIFLMLGFIAQTALAWQIFFGILR